MNFAAAFSSRKYGATRKNAIVSDNNFQMESDNYTGSSFGMKGEEDLADDVKAGFILENGFSADSGSLNASSKLFNLKLSFMSRATPA